MVPRVELPSEVGFLCGGYPCTSTEKEDRMDLQLHGKQAPVTGSTAGIGLAIAQE